MAANLATLRVELESRIAAQAKAAEDGLRGMAKAMEGLGDETKETDEVLKRASQTHAKWVVQIDGDAAATKKAEAAQRSYAISVEQTNDKYRRGQIPLEKAQQEIARYSVILKQATDAAIAHGAAVEQRFSPALQRSVAGMKSATDASRSFADQTGQTTSALRQMGMQQGGLVGAFATGGAFGVGMAAATAAIEAVGKAVRAIPAAGDAALASVSRLSATLGDMGTAATIFERLSASSRQTGVAVAESASSFQRFSVAASDIGATNEQVLSLVSGLQKFAIVSGASTQETAAATQQIGQALASGVLQGDELRSILENMPMFAQSLARELGTSIGGLRAMGSEGKLTAEVVFPAMLRAVQGVDDVFGKMPVTMARAQQQFDIAAQSFLVHLDQALGFSEKLTRALQVAANMVDKIRGFSGGATGAERTAELIAGVARQTETVSAYDQAIRDARGAGADPQSVAMLERTRNDAAAELRSFRDELGQINKEAVLRDEAENEAASEKRLSADVASHTKSVDELRKKYDDKYRIDKEYTDGVAKLDKARNVGAVSEAAYLNISAGLLKDRDEALKKLNKTEEVHRTGLEKLANTYDVQIAAAKRLTAAYGVSRAEVTRITAAGEAEAKAISNGLIPGKKAYADEVERTTARILELRRAQGESKIAEQIRDVDEATEAQLRINAAYDGTAESLERVTAQEKAHAAALKSGIEPGMKEYEATVGKLSDSYIRGSRAAEDFRHIQSSVQAVTDILSTAFDRLGQGIVDAFLSGKGAAVSFSNIVRSVLASAATSLVQLGAVNPLLNSLGGGSRASLWTGLGALTGGGGGISGEATGGLNIMNAASNASTFGGITDALGLTGFGRQLSGIGDYLGLTGSNGLFGGVGNGISGILNTSLWGASPGIQAATASQIVGATAPSGMLSEAAIAGNMGISNSLGSAGLTIGQLASGVGLGFGAGSFAGGLLQSSLGKVGPAPMIGAGGGAIGGALAGTFLFPGIGTVLGGLLGGLLGGAGGGLIGPKAANPFSATGLTNNNGMLAVGQTFSQIVDVSQEVATLQQQTAQINSILAQSNLRIANGVSADNFGQQRIIGGNTGQWLNFGQGDGRPGSIADAFGELRFSATGNDPLNSYLSGRSFGTLEDLQAQVQRITQFVDTTVPALIALGETTKTFGDGSLSANLAALTRQFDDAIDRARELGLEETALTNARDAARSAVQKSLNETLDESQMSFDMRWRRAKSVNDNNPRIAFDATLTEFDARARQEREIVSNQLLQILGDSGKTSERYLSQMAYLESALYEERLALLTQFNSQAIQSDQYSLAARARGEQSALATVTRLSEYSNSLTFSDASPLSAQDKYSAAISNFRSVSEGIGQSDFNSLSRLPEAANDLLGASRGLFGSGAQYAADFATVQTVLRGAASQSPENIVAQAIQATEAQQTAVLGSLLEQMIGRLDLLLTETRFQAMKAAA